MNNTDAIRGDAVRRLGRVGRMLRLLGGGAWESIGKPLCSIAGCTLAVAVTFALLGVLSIPLAHTPFFTRPDGAPIGLYARGMLVGFVGVLVVLAGLLAYTLPRDLYRALRRAWLVAGQPEPEYGEPDGALPGWWFCTRCLRNAPPYVERCNGRREWHPPVLRPESER